MAEFKNWDHLTDHVKECGNLICCKLGVLMEIYGTCSMNASVSDDIIASLNRRGYGIQPRSLAHREPSDWVRIYFEDSFIGRVIQTVQTIRPIENQKLRALAREGERDQKIQALLALAKSIPE